jgi:hypothetical protein
MWKWTNTRMRNGKRRRLLNRLRRKRSDGHFARNNIHNADRDSCIRIATRYGLGGPGIESRWGQDFPHSSRPALEPIQSSIQWVPDPSRGLSDRGVALTTHPI